MYLRALKTGLVSVSSAFIASLCCLLPLMVVLLGLGSGAFMSVTMQYCWTLVPIGAIGVTQGYYLYLREKSRCASLGCYFVGRKFNLILLAFATVIVSAELFLALFPEIISELLQQAM